MPYEVLPPTVLPATWLGHDSLTGLSIRRREDLEEHGVDVGEGLDVDPSAMLVQPGLTQAGDQTWGRPATAQLDSESGVGLGVEHGTTMTVGSLGISLYTVEEITTTLVPA